MWSFTVREKTITSSKYTRHVCHRKPDKMMSRARWKEAGAFTRPNRSRKNRNKLVCDVNVVLSLSSAATGICQDPEFQSRVKNTVASPRESRQSSIFGIG